MNIYKAARYLVSLDGSGKLFSSGSDAGVLRLCILLQIANDLKLAEKKELLFPEPFFAEEYGAACPVIMEEYKNIIHRERTEPIADEQDICFLQRIYWSFCMFPMEKLMAVSKMDPAWREKRKLRFILFGRIQMEPLKHLSVYPEWHQSIQYISCISSNMEMWHRPDAHTGYFG